MDVNLFEAQPVPSAIWPRELGDNLRAFATAVRAVLLDAELPRDVFVGWARASLTCSETTWRCRRRASFLPGCSRPTIGANWPRQFPEFWITYMAERTNRNMNPSQRNILAWDVEDSRIATLSADHAPTAIIGCPDMTTPCRARSGSAQNRKAASRL